MTIKEQLTELILQTSGYALGRTEAEILTEKINENFSIDYVSEIDRQRGSILEGF